MPGVGGTEDEPEDGAGVGEGSVELTSRAFVQCGHRKQFRAHLQKHRDVERESVQLQDDQTH